MIKIEIWSDINCPFCYIGKKHLESALESFPKRHEVKVYWRSFELDPFVKPPKGMNEAELVAKKYNKDLGWVKKMNDNLTEMAALAGLDFKLDKSVPANSFNAHRLVHLARKFNKEDEMVERIFSAKFCEGQDIGDTGVLRSLASEIGLNLGDVNALLESDLCSEDVRRDEDFASQLGITGVPFFVFNEKTGLSGAHPVETFVDTLKSLTMD